MSSTAFGEMVKRTREQCRQSDSYLPTTCRENGVFSFNLEYYNGRLELADAPGKTTGVWEDFD